MITEDYVKSFIVAGTTVDLGMDDYGQCFYIEYKDKDGSIRELSLGTYNEHYMESIYTLLDPVYKKLCIKEATNIPLTDDEKVILKTYEELFEKEYED